MPRNKKTSIRVRLLLLVGLVSMATLSIFSYFAISERNELLTSASEDVFNKAKRIALEQNKIIDFAQSLENILIQVDTLGVLSNVQSCEKILYALRQDTRLTNIVFASPNGDVICSATAPYLRRNIADREYFQKAITSNQVVIGEPIKGRLTGKWGIPISKGVRDKSGKIKNILIVTIDPLWINNELSQQNSGDSRAGLIDSKGIVLARYPDPDNWIGHDASHTKFFSDLIAQGGKGAIESLGFDGINRIYGVAHFAETTSGPIYLWIGIAKDSVTNRVNRDFAWTISGCLILTLVFFGVVWIGSEKLLLRPITVISDVARKLGRGDYQARTDLKYSNDEIGSLAESMDKMAIDLQSSSEIRHHYEQRLNTIIQSAPVPLLMVNSKSEIVMMNSQTEALFQYTPEELIGQKIEVLVPSQFRDAHIHHRKSFLNAPVSRPMSTGGTLMGMRKNGEEFPLEVGLGVIHDQDEHLILAACFDASSRKEAEAMLVKAKHQSEAASLTKSEFLANMSHEIRTPMNAILGLTQLTLDSELNPKQRDHLQKVFRSSKALLGILDDILDYSKIEAGKLNIEQVEFSLGEVVTNVSELFSAQISEKGLELFIEIDRNIHDRLIGDPLRIGQILNNLVGNAIKFTDQGEIHIKVEVIRVEDGLVTLRFAVKDTGIGMDKTQSDKLFTAFNQADTSITRKYGGTGLGLSISKRLVELMGGEIAFSSAPDEGSTFSFKVSFGQGSTQEAGTTDFGSKQHIPVTSSASSGSLGQIQTTSLPTNPSRAQEARVDLYELAAPIRGARILLVEDSDINQEVATEFLSKAGLVTIIANHGGEAVDWVKKEKFDAVLMDVQMPFMDGIEATRLIRNLPQGSRLPILALSAAAMHQDKQAAEQAGMNGHISKPFDPIQLIRALLKVITPFNNEPSKVNAPNNSREVAQTLPGDLPGFELQGALVRLGGNQAMMIKLLLRFAADYASFSSQIDECLQAKQPDKAASLLHRIRGVSLTLGANVLAETAKKFEVEIRSGASLESRDAFASCLDNVVKAIMNNIVPAQESVTVKKHPPNIELINAGIAELAASFRNSEIPSGQKWAEFQSNIGSFVSSQLLNELNLHIQNFDFDLGSKVLGKIENEWRETAK